MIPDTIAKTEICIPINSIRFSTIPRVIGIINTTKTTISAQKLNHGNVDDVVESIGKNFSRILISKGEGDSFVGGTESNKSESIS